MDRQGHVEAGGQFAAARALAELPCSGIPLEEIEGEVPHVSFDLDELAPEELTVSHPGVLAAARQGHDILRSLDSLSFGDVEDAYLARREALLGGEEDRPGEYWGLLLLRAHALSLGFGETRQKGNALCQGLKVIAQLWGALLGDVSGRLPAERAQQVLSAIHAQLSSEERTPSAGLLPAERAFVGFSSDVWNCLWQLFRLHPQVDAFEPRLLQALSLVFEAYEYRLAIRFSSSLISDSLYINVLPHRAQCVLMGLVDALTHGIEARPEELDNMGRALWFGQRMVTLADELGCYSRRLASGDLSGEMVSAAIAIGAVSPARLEGVLDRPEIADQARQELERRWDAAANALQQMIPLVPWVDLEGYLSSLTRLRSFALPID